MAAVADDAGVAVKRVLDRGYTTKVWYADPIGGGSAGEYRAVMGDRWQSAGSERDLATGLVYSAGRYYSEDMGRYVGEDPDGLSSGNAYRYARNSPKNITVGRRYEGDLFKRTSDFFAAALPLAYCNWWPHTPKARCRIMPPAVSLTLIVRDEAHRLAACLDSVRGLFEELVVVDTGSTDDTPAIAASCGATVSVFPWCDDFAAARNHALRRANCPWVFWLDADDRIDDLNRQRLATLFGTLGDEDAAFAVTSLSPADSPGSAGTAVTQVRLFRNHPATAWEYRVHEQVTPSLRRRNVPVRMTDAVILHTGYRDEAERHRKAERNLRLLRLDEADRPGDPFVRFNLGWALLDLGRPDEALPHLNAALELSRPVASIVRKVYALLTVAYRATGRVEEAFAACRAGTLRCPDDLELRFLLGQLLADRGDTAAAVACFESLIGSPRVGYLGSFDPALTGPAAHRELALLHRRQGRDDRADHHLRLAATP